jgi:hypothetical protein
MGTKGFLTGLFPSSWKSSIGNGEGGALPPAAAPLLFSISVAGPVVEEKKSLRNSGGAGLRSGPVAAAAALELLRRRCLAVGL